MSDCRHPRIRILNSTVPIDAVKCFFNPPRVPARVSVTVKSDLVPELIMPRLIGVSRNGLKFKFVKAVCPCRTHFPISGKTFPISTPEIFMACYRVARNYPIRSEITKPQTPMVISLWLEDSSRMLNFIVIGRAGLAQSVERLTAEREVAGSIPGDGQILKVLK